MHFGKWPDSIHDDPEQLKRIEKSKKADLKPLTIDLENRVCTIQGSGKEPYYVSLDSCTCSDFTRRNLPCKHIYRLASELGQDNSNLQYGINKKELNEKLFSLPVECQKLLYDMSYFMCCQNKKHFLYSKKHNLLPLVANGFFIENVDSFYPAAEQSDAGYLRELLDDSGLISFKPGTRQKTILNWFEENEANNLQALKDNFTALEVTEEAWELRHSIKRRFEQR